MDYHALTEAPFATDADVRAVLDANVRWAMQQRRVDPSSDTRTPGQMRAEMKHGENFLALERWLWVPGSPHRGPGD